MKDESPFSPTEIGFLFTFLARQISQGETTFSQKDDLQNSNWSSCGNNSIKESFYDILILEKTVDISTRHA